MGSNRRYADSVDKAMSKRADESVMRDREPTSLTPSELELSTYPLTRTPIPVPVRAWVRYGAVALKVDARAVAWTSRAVAIEWDTPGGSHRAWVWSSAVERAR
jgi:hypothetical protein